jgi:molybdopterin-guanine dinucleotide biosynthesis protein A
MGPHSKKIAATCLILAGGKGRRLTPDKPLLEIDDQPTIALTASVVVPLFEKGVFLLSPKRKGPAPKIIRRTGMGAGGITHRHRYRKF